MTYKEPKLDNDYGIIGPMSVPQFARHIGMNRNTLDTQIANGEGPRIIRFPNAQRSTRRILKCDAIAWLRMLEQ